MSDLKHTAIGPALGYQYQFERATYRLMEADNAVVFVGVEHIDDVSVHHKDGTTIREQDKATIGTGGPLTDRSVALWKTIAIWSEALLANPEILSSTEFHLVTNGRVDANSLAARIHAAKTRHAMESVATEMLATVEDLREELQPFGTKVRAASQGQLAALIGRTFVLDDVSASFGGNLEELQSLRFLGELQRMAVFDNAASWVRRAVLAAARSGNPTVIQRDEFDREVRALLRRVTAAPLAVAFEGATATVDPANYRSHGFFQQLDWIDTEPSFVRDCVIHYVQAQATRVKWTDTDAISEASLLAYQEDLKLRWKLQVRRQELRTYPSPLVKGKELLTETLAEDSVLDGQPMPKAITCGNFHALADFDCRTDPEIGWHPDFEDLAKAAKGGS